MEARIDALVADPEGVRGKKGRVIDEVIAALDDGTLRVAEPGPDGWITHAWIKRAILLYFSRMENVPIRDAQLGDGALKRADDAREFLPSYFDKVPTKRNYKKLGVRCVPPGVARYGSFLGRGCVLMPGYVNIGAYVDEGTMVDTWATVGSCAQIGKNVHLSGGVGIGGVLEPPNARPVVIGDEAMIGSRSMIVEGARVGRGAVVGSGTNLSASMPVIDVETGEELGRGRIPDWCVAVGGTRLKEFPGGTFGMPAVLVIRRLEPGVRHDKSQLNDILRDHGISA